MNKDTKTILTKLTPALRMQQQLLRVQNERLNEIEQTLQELVEVMELVTAAFELYAKNPVRIVNIGESVWPPDE